MFKENPMPKNEAELDNSEIKDTQESDLTEEQLDDLADYFGVSVENKDSKELEEEIDKKVNDFFNSDQGEQLKKEIEKKSPGIIKSLGRSKLVRIALVIASLGVAELSTATTAFGQDNTEQVENNKEREKTYEDNYIIKNDIRRWIHYIKSNEFIDDLNEDKDKVEEAMKKITDVSEEEEKKVYDFLEKNMNVWNVSALSGFSSKLWLLDEMIRKEGLDLDTAKTQPIQKPDFIMGIKDNEVEKNARSNAVTMYLELKNLLDK